MVRAFRMNPKFGDSSSSQVETFLKIWYFRKNIRSGVSKMDVIARTQLIFRMLTLFQRNYYTTRGNIKKHGTANVSNG